MTRARLILIDVRYACFGIETVDEVVVSAPPIARWMLGKSVWYVLRWVKRKHGAYKYVSRR